MNNARRTADRVDAPGCGRRLPGWAILILAAGVGVGRAQPYAPPDRGAPGDEMIQAYLQAETGKLEQSFLGEVTTAEQWEKLRPRFKEEYLYMLGLWPLPEKTPLQATVTGRLEGEGYRVEMLHYQSRPHWYVTANLFRPATQQAGERLPAVLHVCGHSARGRDGNKVAYQTQGIWFARHGCVCLVVDSLQLGEIGALHHGTYREGRWWWHSRGYTPAGVECWNGVRGLDYLVSRPDVDPERLAVTGISGGGAASFWVAAADERVRVAVPVSGMADLESYVCNRVINGHCDCMFLYNTFGWPWTRIAGLVAPRPLQFANSDQDKIFPMDANERVINRLKRLYSLFGESDAVESVVSVGGHAYRKDLRQAFYRFINLHLKNDPRKVLDSEVDVVAGSGTNTFHPIAPARLRVFPTDADLPKDELNTRSDEFFVPRATVAVPRPGGFEAWRDSLRTELRRVTFRYFPERIAPARAVGQTTGQTTRLQTEPGIEIRLRELVAPKAAAIPARVWLCVAGDPPEADAVAGVPGGVNADEVAYLCEPRGVGETRWTRKNPPNYVERAHVLLGRTVDTGRVWDLIAAARYLNAKFDRKVPVFVAGRQGGAVLAAYAALWEPEIAGLVLEQPVLSHMSPAAPPLLNVLRVCDVPHVLGMLAPRPLTLRGAEPDGVRAVRAIYAAAGAESRLTVP